MSLLFISHSSKDNLQAVAIKDWLVAEGWNDIFLDLDPEHGIAGGEKWEQALLNAANRCDAVLYLISQSWLASEWCRWEFQLAQKLNKRLFILLIEDIPIAELPKELTESWQLVNLNAANDQVQSFNVQLPDSPDLQEINFSASGLSRLKTGLNKAGLDPSFFAWPPKNDPDRAPYRGLLALEADDAGIFFGRDAPIIDLMAQLRGLRELSAPRMMVILGASGAGKSSFLRAGILPRLARDDRYFHVLPIIRPERAAIHGVNGLIASFAAVLPEADRQYIESELVQGEEGLHRLLAAIASVVQVAGDDGRQAVTPTLVISIDQAEELFQAEGSHEANQLLNIIRYLLTQDNPQVMVLFTIRSDSYEYLQSAAPLEGVTQKTFSLPAMPRGSYQQVIEGPAKLLSKSNRPLKVTPQLTEQLLQDIEQGGARDALPLLAFTLEQLYLGYSDDGELSRDDYLQMGGIEGAIKSAVEHALQDAHLNPHIPQDRYACLALLKRGLIPWLAGIDPQTNLPRRRVALMSEIPEEARPLIQHFIAHRLLATDTNERGEITVEPAHEALLRQWTILKGWLEEDAAALSALETLRNACRDWEANLREDKWLIHTGGRLDDAESLARDKHFNNAFNKSLTSYIYACRAETNKLLREVQKKRRFKVYVAATFFLFLSAASITVYFKNKVAEQGKYFEYLTKVPSKYSTIENRYLRAALLTELINVDSSDIVIDMFYREILDDYRFSNDILGRDQVHTSWHSDWDGYLSYEISEKYFVYFERHEKYITLSAKSIDGESDVYAGNIFPNEKSNGYNLWERPDLKYDSGYFYHNLYGNLSSIKVENGEFIKSTILSSDEHIHVGEFLVKNSSVIFFDEKGRKLNLLNKDTGVLLEICSGSFYEDDSVRKIEFVARDIVAFDLTRMGIKVCNLKTNTFYSPHEFDVLGGDIRDDFSVSEDAGLISIKSGKFIYIYRYEKNQFIERGRIRMHDDMVDFFQMDEVGRFIFAKYESGKVVLYNANTFFELEIPERYTGKFSNHIFYFRFHNMLFFPSGSGLMFSLDLNLDRVKKRACDYFDEIKRDEGKIIWGGDVSGKDWEYFFEGWHRYDPKCSNIIDG